LRSVERRWEEGERDERSGTAEKSAKLLLASESKETANSLERRDFEE